MNVILHLKKRFLDFLIDPDVALKPNDGAFKIIILRGFLALVGIIVGILYIFIDRFNGISGNEPYYVACSVISFINLFLIRSGKFRTATILSVSVMNFLIFLFSASDSYRSGVYIFFVANSLTAVALFGYKDRKIALLFVLMAIALFMISFWTDHTWLPRRVFNENSIQREFSFNFIISLTTCIAIVSFLIDLNFNSEKQIMAKNEQLAKANSELDSFVYSASHDMRAPLSSILGLVQIYELSKSEEEKNQVVNLIRSRANKLDEFIREILDYSRNSRLGLNLIMINPKEIVSEVIEELRYAKDFEKLKIEILPCIEDLVYTDRDRLKVIMNNILANAIKYHDPSKQSPFIKINFDKKGSCWSISIEDNGIGIPTNHHAKIFDMFYRANEKSEGSGLGLYIAKETTERLGGSIALHSEYEKGSTFIITFFENPESTSSVKRL